MSATDLMVYCKETISDWFLAQDRNLARHESTNQATMFVEWIGL
jgi:hypothetical protein